MKPRPQCKNLNNPISIETDVHFHDNRHTWIDEGKRSEEKISCSFDLFFSPFPSGGVRSVGGLAGRSVGRSLEVERQADHARRAARNNSKVQEQVCFSSRGKRCYVVKSVSPFWAWF